MGRRTVHCHEGTQKACVVDLGASLGLGFGVKSGKAAIVQRRMGSGPFGC